MKQCPGLNLILLTTFTLGSLHQLHFVHQTIYTALIKLLRSFINRYFIKIPCHIIWSWHIGFIRDNQWHFHMLTWHMKITTVNQQHSHILLWHRRITAENQHYSHILSCALVATQPLRCPRSFQNTLKENHQSIQTPASVNPTLELRRQLDLTRITTVYLEPAETQVLMHPLVREQDQSMAVHLSGRRTFF